MHEYYCLRKADGKVYKVWSWQPSKSSENPNDRALSMDSIFFILEYDAVTGKQLHLQYMLGSNNAVGVFSDTIQRYFDGVDGTEINRYAHDGILDSVEILQLTREVPWDTTRRWFFQTVLFGDTTLPAIAPINVVYPEVRYLPSVVKNDKRTWRLNDVFYDKIKIDYMLSVLYRDDIKPLTQGDVDYMINSYGMSKKEWWDYVKKQAEKIKGSKE
jgi:hypothetical protein